MRLLESLLYVVLTVTVRDAIKATIRIATRLTIKAS